MHQAPNLTKHQNGKLELDQIVAGIPPAGPFRQTVLLSVVRIMDPDFWPGSKKRSGYDLGGAFEILTGLHPAS